MNDIITIKNLVYNLSLESNVEHKDVKLVIQNYLHYINSIKDKDLINDSFKDEPKRHSNLPQSIYAYLAAIVEKVSSDLKLSVPNWIKDKYYYLENEWFPPEIEKLSFLKDKLKSISAEPFKSRNLYVSQNAISVY